LKKLLLSLLAVATLSVAAFGAAYASTEARAWREACLISGYNCSKWAPPSVKYDEFGLEKGLYGYYSIGTSVVFVSTGLHPDVTYGIMLHEMVHYMQYRYAQDHSTVLGMNHCAAEREAFEVSDTFFLRVGLDRYARNGDLSGYEGCEGASGGRKNLESP
jgi:hypothetical protein